MKEKHTQHVWISGATGFVGRQVVQQGLARGNRITIAGRRAPKTVANNDALSFSEVDLRNLESIQVSLEQSQPNLVIHLGASGVSDRNSDFVDLLTINTQATVEIAQTLAKMDHSPKLIMAGSGFEYGNHCGLIDENAVATPVNAYGVTKLAATNALRLFQDRLSSIVLRSFGVYGPGEAAHRLIPYSILQAKKGEPVEVTPGLQERDFLFVDDVASAFWRASEWIADKENVFEICNLGSGKPVSLRDLLTKLQCVLHDRQIDADYRFGAKEYRDNEVMLYAANIAKIEKLLGWHPETDLDDGLQQTVASLLSQTSGVS